MNELLKELEKQAYVEVTTWERDPPSGYLVEFTGKEFSREKFAELIIKKCADAADMAHNARCKYPGDYIVEHMGLGNSEGAATFRSEK